MKYKILNCEPLMDAQPICKISKPFIVKKEPGEILYDAVMRRLWDRGWDCNECRFSYVEVVNG